MERKQKQQIEAYGRIRAFLADHPLESPTTYGAPQRMLEEVIARLDSLAVTKSEGGREYGGGTIRLKALHRELRVRHLRPIAAIARAVMGEAPGIGVALRLPANSVAVTRLVTEAQAIRNAVSPYAESFVENGRPIDFLQQVDAAVAALQGCLVARDRRKVERMGARKAIRDEIRRGRNAVDMLDAVVRSRFVNAPFTLAKWEAARRLVGVSRSGSPTAAREVIAEAA